MGASVSTPLTGVNEDGRDHVDDESMDTDEEQEHDKEDPPLTDDEDDPLPGTRSSPRKRSPVKYNDRSPRKKSPSPSRDLPNSSPSKVLVSKFTTIQQNERPSRRKSLSPSKVVRTSSTSKPFIESPVKYTGRLLRRRSSSPSKESRSSSTSKMMSNGGFNSLPCKVYSTTNFSQSSVASNGYQSSSSSYHSVGGSPRRRSPRRSGRIIRKRSLESPPKATKAVVAKKRRPSVPGGPRRYNGPARTRPIVDLFDKSSVDSDGEENGTPPSVAESSHHSLDHDYCRPAEASTTSSRSKASTTSSRSKAASRRNPPAKKPVKITETKSSTANGLPRRSSSASSSTISSSSPPKDLSPSPSRKLRAQIKNETIIKPVMRTLVIGKEVWDKVWEKAKPVADVEDPVPEPVLSEDAEVRVAVVPPGPSNNQSLEPIPSSSQSKRSASPPKRSASPAKEKSSSADEASLSTRVIGSSVDGETLTAKESQTNVEMAPESSSSQVSEPSSVNESISTTVPDQTSQLPQTRTSSQPSALPVSDPLINFHTTLLESEFGLSDMDSEIIGPQSTKPPAAMLNINGVAYVPLSSVPGFRGQWHEPVAGPSNPWTPTSSNCAMNSPVSSSDGTTNGIANANVHVRMNGLGYSRYDQPRPTDGPMNGFPIRRKSVPPPVTPTFDDSFFDDGYMGQLMAVRRKLSTGNPSNVIILDGNGDRVDGGTYIDGMGRKRRRKQVATATHPLVSKSRGPVKPPSKFMQCEPSIEVTKPTKTYTRTSHGGGNTVLSPTSRLITKVARKSPATSMARTRNIMEGRERYGFPTLSKPSSTGTSRTSSSAQSSTFQVNADAYTIEFEPSARRKPLPPDATKAAAIERKRLMDRDRMRMYRARIRAEKDKADQAMMDKIKRNGPVPGILGPKEIALKRERQRRMAHANEVRMKMVKDKGGNGRNKRVAKDGEKMKKSSALVEKYRLQRKEKDEKVKKVMSAEEIKRRMVPAWEGQIRRRERLQREKERLEMAEAKGSRSRVRIRSPVTKASNRSSATKASIQSPASKVSNQASGSKDRRRGTPSTSKTDGTVKKSSAGGLKVKLFDSPFSRSMYQTKSRITRSDGKKTRSSRAYGT